MKAINILFKLAAIAALSLALVACESDPCKDATDRCLNGAECDAVDGGCLCAAGYEGDSCSVVSRTRFIGDYTAKEVATVGGISYDTDYTLVIKTASASLDKILIEQLSADASGNSITATVSGSTFTAPDGSKVTVDGLIYEVRGLNGSMGTDGKLTVNYALHSSPEGVKLFDCVTTGTKK